MQISKEHYHNLSIQTYYMCVGWQSKFYLMTENKIVFIVYTHILYVYTGAGETSKGLNVKCRAAEKVRMRWYPWWRHPMETFSALLAICAGNSPVSGEFPAQRPVTRSFDVFFDLRLNKPLSKQSWGWWFETPSRPLWRHCNAYDIATAYLYPITHSYCILLSSHIHMSY